MFIFIFENYEKKKNFQIDHSKKRKVHLIFAKKAQSTPYIC